MAAIAWLLIIAMLGSFFDGLLERERNPNQDVATAVTADGSREVVLTRNRQGHYLANGEINGVAVTFMLDTGATAVALGPELARKVGVVAGQPVVTRTANGSVRGYRTTLESVKLGNIEQADVPATVSPGLDGMQVLLGMSFLRHLELIQRGETMTLRQL